MKKHYPKNKNGIKVVCVKDYYQEDKFVFQKDEVYFADESIKDDGILYCIYSDDSYFFGGIYFMIPYFDVEKCKYEAVKKIPWFNNYFITMQELRKQKLDEIAL